MNRADHPALLPQETQTLVADIRSTLAGANQSAATRTIAKRWLGARPVARENGDLSVQFGVWMPGIVDGPLADKHDSIWLEILTPSEQLDLTTVSRDRDQSLAAHRTRIPLSAAGEYLVGVASNIRIGNRAELGALYWFRYDDGERCHIVRDPLAASLPFGVYAPAEVFDVAGMLAARRDMEYMRTHVREVLPDGTYRARDVGTHLEVHTETATADGTFAALADRYRAIGAKIQANVDSGNDLYAGLSPAEQTMVGFDSIELTPEVPPAEREDVTVRSGEFFAVEEGDVADAVLVRVRHPDISNWGYDTPILGSAAINPSVLGTLRPNEFLDFVETVHNLPGRPIQLCIDSVLGHCDFQGARLLQTFERQSADHEDLKYVNSAYLRGANMYGRDIDFARPEVQALLLELLERKLAYGFDAVRVDGAQDFVADRDPVTGLRIQHDDFLNEMANIVVDVNGIKRRPDFNLEDGRPWPDDINWLYNSKYLDHTIERTLPFGDQVKQWSPIIFAHNVHGKFKWFFNKWDRFVEVFRYGRHWITGNSNHDNARYFYRMTEMTPASDYRPGAPFENYYNDELGSSMPEAAHNALDHGALTAMMLAFLPGNPMFMLNVLFHTPWTFIRDIDSTYDVKIAAEEGARYLTWYVDEDLYDRPNAFVRLKELGFTTLRSLVAPPPEKERHPGFADRLDQLRLGVKTDALAARYLFDDPDDGGGYGDADVLAGAVERIRDSETGGAHWEAMGERIGKDPIASANRVSNARALCAKTLSWLERRLARVSAVRAAQIQRTIDRLRVLETCSDHEIALLLEDAASMDDYNPARWATDIELVRQSPAPMRDDSDRIGSGMLSAYARAFMLDAGDAATVSNYEEDLDPDETAFRLALRRFRTDHAWLTQNPSNEVRRDYFARKLLPNGAKETGDWGDRGDLVNCNTMYYGWRTSPDGREQVFVIANMEGAPIDHCSLSIFLNLPGEWSVAAASPALGKLPARVDRSFVIEDFRNGDALVLVRTLGAD